MAVRDFVDEKGMKWRVWPVLRSSIHPKTAAEDYLGDYGEGWLCFESQHERRRLARFPETSTGAPVPRRMAGTPSLSLAAKATTSWNSRRLDTQRGDSRSSALPIRRFWSLTPSSFVRPASSRR